MTLFELINKLAATRVKLTLENGELSLSAPKGAVTPFILAVIKDHKTELVEYLQKSETRAPKIIPTQRDGSTSIPLSFPQQRMWFIDQLQGGSANYNTPMAFEVEGTFDVAVAQYVLQIIVNRHEVLRTVYQAIDDSAVQCIREGVVCPFSKIDLCHLKGEEQEAEIKRLVSEDANRVFDLSEDVMFRASWLSLSPARGVLLFNMHHIAFDGWSMGVLINEFMHLYQTFEAGERNTLPELEIQYADFSIWQHEYLQGEEFKRQLDYWRKQLKEAPAVHSIPLDYERPAEPSLQGEEVKGQLSAEVASKLISICHEKGVTPFMVVHAALSLVLSRHSNSTDIVVGTPVANRFLNELEPLIGYFSNTLVLRSNTKVCLTFDEYLIHIKEVNSGAQANQEVPFEQLVEHLNIARSGRYSPLFQIMLSMDTNEKKERNLSGVCFSSIDRGEVVSKFDLQLNAQMTSDGVYLSWIYNKALFLPASIGSLNANLQRLLSSIAETPNAALDDLSILSKEEIDYLIYKLNESTKEYESEALVHELFEKQAEREPQKIVAVVGDERLTNRALNEASNQLAHYLREQGVGPDTLVGICINQSSDMLIGLLGILKSGGAYVALDPTHPSARLEYIIEDTEFKYLLTQSGLVNGLTLPGSIQVIDLDFKSNMQQLQSYSTLNPKRSRGQNNINLAYVIYTSGSTGQPKGVMIEHRGLNNLAEEMQTWCLFGEDECEEKAWGWSASYTFDASLQAILQLMLGRRVVLLPQELKLNPEKLVNWIALNDIGVIDCTPSLVELWFSAGIAEKLPNLVIGGEAINEGLWKQIIEWQMKGRRAWNVYGPTECTVNSTYCRVEGAQTNIGKPLKYTKAYLLNDKLQPAPYGTIAELYIGGVGLARGYLNRPDLTKDRFIKNHFIDNVAERLYRTGDLVRYLANGNLEFLGRIDDQVKIRGFRIELGEIEQLVSQKSEIKSSIARVGGVLAQLQLYVIPSKVPRDESEFIADLRLWLQSKLPEYMVPSEFVIMEKWPLTASGKIDKKSLPVPDEKYFWDDYVAPKNEIEEKIVDIWADLLSIERDKLSTHANFFDMGGHSLLAVKLAARLNSTFDMDDQILIRSVFDYQQIKDQAALITGAIEVTTQVSRISESLSPDSIDVETVYFIPGVAAMATTFRDIAKQSKDLFNVRAFNHSGLFSGSEPFTGVKDNAEFYLEHIFRQKSEGPYFIAGHSYGGAIALEMVGMLERLGHKANLILLDTYFEQSKWIKQDTPAELQTVSQDQEVDRRALALKEALMAMYPTLSAQDIEKLEVSNEGNKVFFERLLSLYEKQSKLFNDYEPLQGLTTNVLNVVASDSGSLAFIGRKQPATLTRENIVHKVVEGDHYSMLTHSGSKEICSIIALFIGQEQELLWSGIEGV